MSREIDERIVSMRFDNAQFESNARATMKTLDDFDAKLEFKNASRGVENVNKAANSIDLSGLSQAAEAVEVKFSAMSVMAISALDRIVNKAMDAGSALLQSLTIAPISQGFDEYELKMGSVQTIMASTGEKLEDVNRYLDELNTYADKTIYSFADMTNNIGKFTNAGVPLKDAVAAIQGISNAAALAGATTQQASHAMYNFAQGISTGFISLLDWKSIEVATLDTKEFKEELIKTALNVGTLKEAANGMYQTLKGRTLTATTQFRDSLRDQWLTTEVLTQTLAKYSSETEDIGRKAFEAATQVKTFTQLLDTLKEAVGSGWAQSFELIIGDFNEAKELWTSVSNAIGSVIDAQAKQRNEILQSWRDFGGREALIQSFANMWEALLSIITPVRDAIREIFPVTGEGLANLTKAFQRFTEAIKLSEEASYTLKVVIKALILPFRVLWEVIKTGVTILAVLVVLIARLTNAFLAMWAKGNPIADLFKRIFGEERYAKIAEALSTSVSKIAEAFKNLGARIKNAFSSDAFKNGTNQLYQAFKPVLDLFKQFGGWLLDRVVDGFQALASIDWSKVLNIAWTNIQGAIVRIGQGLEYILTGIKNIYARIKEGGIGEFFAVIGEGLTKIRDLLVGVTQNITGVGQAFDQTGGKTNALIEFFKGLGDALMRLLQRLTPGKVLIFAFGVAVTGVFLSIGKAIGSFSEAIQAATGTLGSISGFFKAMTKNLKASPIKQLAIAIAVLAGSMVALSMVDPNRLKQATTSLIEAIGAFAALATVITILNKITKGSGDLTKSVTALTLLSASILILVGAMNLLNDITLDASFLIKIGILAAVFTGLIAAYKYISKSNNDIIKASASFTILSASLLIIAKAINILADIDMEGAIPAVVAMIALMGMMAVLAKAAQKVQTKTDVFGAKTTTKSGTGGILGMAISMLILAGVLKQLSKIDFATILKALPSMIVIVALIHSLMKASSKAGKDSKSAGTNLLAMSAGVLILGAAIKNIGSLDLATIVKGTAAVAAVMILFTALTNMTQTIGKDMKKACMTGTLIAMGVAINLLGLAIGFIGALSLKEVIQGTAVVLAIMAMFGFIMAASQFAKGSTKTIVAITVALTILTSAIVIMTLIPFGEALMAAASLSAVIIAIGVCLKMMGDLGFGKALSQALVMGLFLAEVIAALWVLGQLGKDGKELLMYATALSECLIALGISVRLMNKMTGLKNAKKNAGLFAGLLLEISLALALMTALNVQDSIANATAISELILAFGVITIALGHAGFDKKDVMESAVKGAAAIDAVGILIVGLIGLFGAISSGDENMAVIDRGIVVINKLVDAIPGLVTLLGLTAASGLLGMIPGNFGTIAAGAAGIDAVGILITGFVALMGLINQIPGAEDFFQDGARLMKIVGQAIGDAIGAFFGGVISTFSESIPTLGTNLSSFMDNVGGFIEGAKGIGDDFVTGVQNLAKGIVALTAADVVNGLANWLPGVDNFHSLGEALTEFMPVMKEISDTIGNQNIDIGSVEAAGRAMEGFGHFIQSIPKTGGAWQDFFGEINMATFGEDMGSLADGIVGFSKKIVEGGIDSAAITEAANAAQLLADLENSLPPQGGKLQWWTGEKDLGEFGNQLSTFGIGLEIYSLYAKKVDQEAVTGSANAAQLLVDLANGLPAQGTNFATFMSGQHDLGVFGEQLSKFGYNLKVYAQWVSQMDKTAFDYTDDIADVISKLGDAVEPHFGFVQQVAGEQFLGLFAIELGLFAENFKTYAAAVSEVSDWDAVERSASIGVMLAGICPSLIDYGGAFKLFTGQKSLTFFGEDLKGFAPGFVDFVNGVQGLTSSKLEMAESVTGTVSALIEMISGLNTGKTEGKVDTKIFGVIGAVNNAVVDSQGIGNIKGYGDVLANLGEGIASFAESLDGVDDTKFASAMESFQEFVGIIQQYDASSGSQMLELVSSMSEAFQSFIEAFGDANNVGEIITRSINLMTEAFNSEDAITKFKLIGKNCLGLILTGFEEKHPKMDGTVTILITHIANSFKSEANTGKFRDLGKYVVEGIVQGMNDNTSLLNEAGTRVGETLATSTESDLGIQSPSKRFAEIARYCIEGLLEGVRQNAGVAQEAGAQGANQLLDATNDAFGIEGGTSSKFEAVGEIAANSIAKGTEKNNESVLSQLIDFGKRCAGSIVDGLSAIRENATPALEENARHMVTAMEDSLQIRGDNSAIFSKVGENVVDSLAKPIEEKKRSTYDTFADLGSSCVKGISYGMASFKETALNAARDQAKGIIDETEAALEIQDGVSASFKIVGETVAKGIAGGIKEEEATIQAASKTASEVVLKTAEDYFGIHGNNISIVMKDGVGHILVRGIAEGITAEMSAEEAAEKKAENIVKAFQKGIERASLEMNIAQLQQELWELQNPNATAQETKNHQIESMKDQLKYQAQIMNYNQGAYQAAVNTFGETSDQARAALKTWLQSEKDMYELANQLLELEGNGADKQKENQDKYFTYLQENYENLKKLQYTDEQIKAAAREVSGFDPTAAATGGVAKTAKDIVDSYVAEVEVTIIDTLPNTVTNATVNAYTQGASGAMPGVYQAGASTVDAFNQGAQDAASGTIPDALAEMIPEEYRDKFAGSWAYFFDGGIDAANEGTKEIGTTVRSGAWGILDVLCDVFGIHSPAKATYDIGMYVAQGLINGIAETLGTSGTTAITGIAQQVIEAMDVSTFSPITVGSAFAMSFSTGILMQEETISSNLYTLLTNVITTSEPMVTPYFSDSGTNMASAMMDGLIAGIDNASSGFIMKVQQVAISAYNAAMAALNAHSPSRKFIYVGEMCIAGFVKGLEDNQKDLMTESSSVGQSVVDATTRAVELANRYLENGPDLSPTITPVLDLSQVETSASTIGSLFNTGEAMRLNAEITNARLARSRQNDGDDGSSGAPTYNFTQNNYSPKALSKVDIYRQTRNQFSRFRQEVTR